MAYTDKLGTAITSGDKVAASVRFGANQHRLVIGTITGPYTARGRTYFEIDAGTDKQGTEDRRHTAIRMTGASAGVCDNAVKSGFA